MGRTRKSSDLPGRTSPSSTRTTPRQPARWPPSSTPAARASGARSPCPPGSGRRRGYQGHPGLGAEPLRTSGTASQAGRPVGNTGLCTSFRIGTETALLASALAQLTHPFRRLPIFSKVMPYAQLSVFVSPSSPSTAGFAQPAGFGGGETCSPNSHLRPPQVGEEFAPSPLVGEKAGFHEASLRAAVAGGRCSAHRGRVGVGSAVAFLMQSSVISMEIVLIMVNP